MASKFEVSLKDLSEAEIEFEQVKEFLEDRLNIDVRLSEDKLTLNKIKKSRLERMLEKFLHLNGLYDEYRVVLIDKNTFAVKKRKTRMR